MTGDDPIAVELLGLETKIGRAVYNKTIQLDERSFVQEELEPLASRELAFLVLCLEARLASALLGFRAAPLQKVELLSHGHRSEKLTSRGMSI
jgi:hypothetical protein